jgi:hypothetical protein
MPIENALRVLEMKLTKYSSPAFARAGPAEALPGLVRADQGHGSRPLPRPTLSLVAGLHSLRQLP